MEIIYIDSLMLLNLTIDYLLLLLSARVCGLMLRRGRYFLAAAVGAAYSAGVLLPGMAFLTLPACKLALGGLMALIAFGGEAHVFRCTAVFFAVSAAFAGVVYAAGLLSGSGGGAGLYIPVSFRTLVLAFGLCYGVVRALFSRWMLRAQRQRVEVRLSFLGRSAGFIALRDTGNTLFDPISGARVMVVEPGCLMPIFTREQLRLLAAPAPGRFRSRWRARCGSSPIPPWAAAGCSGPFARRA